MRPVTRSSPRPPTARSSMQRDRHGLRRRRPSRCGRTAELGGDDGPDDVHINDLLELVIQWHGSDLHLTAGSPPVVRVNGELRPLTELPGAQRQPDPPDGVFDHHAEAAGEVRERARARHVATRCRARPLPRQPLPAARQRRLRDARDPVRDRRLRHARRAAGGRKIRVSCRVGSCS